MMKVIVTIIITRITRIIGIITRIIVIITRTGIYFNYFLYSLSILSHLFYLFCLILFLWLSPPAQLRPPLIIPFSSLKFKQTKEAGHQQSNPTHTTEQYKGLAIQFAPRCLIIRPQTTLIPPRHPDQQAHNACYISRATPRVLAASVSTRSASSSRSLDFRLGRQASK